MLNNTSIVADLGEQCKVYDAGYDRLCRTLATDDFMANENYFDVGRSALGAIVTSLISAGISKPRSILDLACGNGRVTRHLKLMFPDSEIVACDLYPEMVDFCVQTFGVTGFYSKEKFSDIDFGRKFDLIWCGSMLTHCDAELFKEAIYLMDRSLTVPGVAVASVHGRRAISLQRYSWKMSAEDAFRPAEREYHRTGFSYMRAPPAETQANFPRNVNLGIGNSLSSMSYVTALVDEMESAQLVYYREMAWNGHQDVFAISRPGVWPNT